MLARFALLLPPLLLAVPRVFAQNSSSSPAPSVKLSGYIQGRERRIRTRSASPPPSTAPGSAPPARVAGDVSWRMQGEFRTGSVGTGRASVSLQDAYVRWTQQSLGIQVGQFKTPFTREFITSLAEVETADRSTVVDTARAEARHRSHGGLRRGRTRHASRPVSSTATGQNVTAPTPTPRSWVSPG